MTEKLNEIASAYVDGEATPEESAWVETNAQAQSVVDNIQRVSKRIRSVEPQGEAVKQRHITAALAAFDDTSITGTTAVENVDSAVTRNVDQREIQGRSGNVIPMPDRPQRRWITPVASAAAVVLVVGAGFALLSSQGGVHDATEKIRSGVSSSQPDTAPSASESGSVADAGPEIPADAIGPAESDSDLESPATTLEDPEQFSTIQASPQEIATFDELPTGDELDEFIAETELETDFANSNCAAGASDFAEGSLVGFIPILLAGEPAELLVFTSGASSVDSVIAVDGDCGRLS